jgi:hypothetical protein
MKLRPEIEPGLAIAEQRYPSILNDLIAYTKLVDEQGDADGIAYKNLEAKLQDTVNKDMSAFNLSEYWEEEGVEVLAFRIALPDPVKAALITKEELTEIVRRLDGIETSANPDEESFGAEFARYLDTYYHRFLQLNFKAYDYKKIFGQQKDGDKKSFWWPIYKKVEILWQGGQIS